MRGGRTDGYEKKEKKDCRCALNPDGKKKKKEHPLHYIQIKKEEGILK